MEHCQLCNLHHKRNSKLNHELTNTHLAANIQNHCQQCKRILNLADKRFHLQSNEHKINKRMWYCEACKMTYITFVGILNSINTYVEHA